MTKQMTPKQLAKAYDRPDLFSLGNSWLNQKAYTEITREEVNKIQSAVLAELPLYQTRGGRLHGDGERILDAKYVFMCEDQNALNEYYNRCDAAERAAGIKPADMDRDHCPALVAENDLMNIEHAIWDITLPFFGIDRDDLFRIDPKTHEMYYKIFTRLTIGAILSHPNFKPVNYADAKKQLKSLQEVKS
jgi:hypothetical protein